MDKQTLPAFAKFVRDLRVIWAENPDDETRMKRAHKLMEGELLTDPALREHCKNWPSTEGRKNLLFYTDPDYGFVINGVVRVPGRTGSVHDHADGAAGNGARGEARRLGWRRGRAGRCSGRSRRTSGRRRGP